MIQQLEQLLHQRGAMTITALSQELDMPASALQGMLDLLLSKDRIKTQSGAVRCGGCTSCDAYQQTSYVVSSP